MLNSCSILLSHKTVGFCSLHDIFKLHFVREKILINRIRSGAFSLVTKALNKMTIAKIYF